jgi:hypothetical protein
MTKYPAVVIVHWPGKDVPACLVHAAKLIHLGEFMGSPVSTTPVDWRDEPPECANCKNEEAKPEVQP